MGLSWDETVYVSQVSRQAPAAWFDPARARGVPVIVAPVEYLTSSIVALRVYLSLLSAAGLVLALLAWRTLRKSWVLALAGVAFGGLWVAQYYGPQAMPDMWSAFGSLAAVGFFLRYAATRTWQSLAGAGGCVAFVALVRPGDAAYLAVPLVAAALAVPAWRSWRLGLAVIAGLAAGGTEWVAEAIVRFGSVSARLHAAGAEQSGFGLHFAVLDELKALNGPTLCRPCTIGYRQPELDVWWLLLPVLAVFGVWAARRSGQLGSSLLAAVCGACLAAQYLFMIDYAAPRFLLPAYALLAIPVADGLSWLVTGVRLDTRPAMAALVAAFMFTQVVAQHYVLDHEAGGTVTFHDDYTTIATRLAALGVHKPCLLTGVQYIPIAFVAGCASAGPGTGAQRVLLLGTGQKPPSYARHWHAYPVRGTTILDVTAYVS